LLAIPDDFDGQVLAPRALKGAFIVTDLFRLDANEPHIGVAGSWAGSKVKTLLSMSATVQGLRNTRFCEQIAHEQAPPPLSIISTRPARSPPRRSLPSIVIGNTRRGGPTMRTAIFAAAAMVVSTWVNAQEIDWKKVDDALGRSAAVTGDVHRYGFPRSDLNVTLDGVSIKPALALGGWVALKPAHGGAMMMGDLVLLETEITPVMTAAIENGLEITAIHNHILRAQPPTFYMHVSGQGDPLKLANALHTTLAASKTPLTASTAAAAASDIGLDTAELDRIVGVKGKPVGGVYQFGIARRDHITQSGMSLDPAGPLGAATGVNFQPTGNGKAAITGDFVLAASEVNPVIRALRTNGIEVTALHSHMLDEQPRLFFMHFWANDDALKLAKGIRAALDQMANAESVGRSPEMK
jgi:hypothetical protein